jgi:hypothetical protein
MCLDLSRMGGAAWPLLDSISVTVWGAAGGHCWAPPLGLNPTSAIATCVPACRSYLPACVHTDATAHIMSSTYLGVPAGHTERVARGRGHYCYGGERGGVEAIAFAAGTEESATGPVVAHATAGA